MRLLLNYQMTITFHRVHQSGHILSGSSNTPLIETAGAGAWVGVHTINMSQSQLFLII